jgi:hypothetical protein
MKKPEFENLVTFKGTVREVFFAYKNTSYPDSYPGTG